MKGLNKIMAEEIRMKAREIIVSKLFDETREKIISSEIELDFLLYLENKIKSGKLNETEDYNKGKIEEDICICGDIIEIFKEKLEYLEEMNRSFPKFSKLTECKMRKNIITELINVVRAEIIEANIENGFLAKINKKIEDGVIRLCSKKELLKDANKLESSISFSVERLNYLKEIRDINKAERIKLSLEYKNSKSAEC